MFPLTNRFFYQMNVYFRLSTHGIVDIERRIPHMAFGKEHGGLLARLAQAEVCLLYTSDVYKRQGFTRAYAFSPDSRRLAYLRFDESEVPLMEMMRFDGKLYNQEGQ